MKQIMKFAAIAAVLGLVAACGGTQQAENQKKIDEAVKATTEAATKAADVTKEAAGQAADAAKAAGAQAEAAAAAAAAAAKAETK